MLQKKTSHEVFRKRRSKMRDLENRTSPVPGDKIVSPFIWIHWNGIGGDDGERLKECVVSSRCESFNKPGGSISDEIMG
jgi:hypothetical protein